MKITKKYLREIIEEELQGVIAEELRATPQYKRAIPNIIGELKDEIENHEKPAVDLFLKGEMIITINWKYPNAELEIKKYLSKYDLTSLEDAIADGPESACGGPSGFDVIVCDIIDDIVAARRREAAEVRAAQQTPQEVEFDYGP